MSEPETAAEQPLQYQEPQKPEEPIELDDGEETDSKTAPAAPKQLEVPDPRIGGAPAWALVPSDLRFPTGRTFQFIRFPSRWTDAPNRGLPLRVDDPAAIRIAGPGALWRQAICWPLDVGDQKHAVMRAMQDPNRFAEELTKQMIRAVDGARSDWGGSPTEGSVDKWWNEIGGRNRSLMQRIWTQLHSHTRENQTAFFESCIEVRAPG